MSHKSFLKGLEQAYTALSNSTGDRAGGLICVVVDHYEDLRERLGYRGLIELDDQLHQLLIDRFGKKPGLFSPGLMKAVALVGQTDAQGLKQLATELFEELNHHDFPFREESVAVTVSMTACCLDMRFGDADRMLIEVIKSAESLSRAGGNQMIEIHPCLSARQASADDRQMLGLLMESLRKDDLQVVFQLLLPASDDPVPSFQMLPRLQTTGGSLVVAAEFLPVATRAGLLGTIDRWMLNHAIRVIDQQQENRELRLFINQSSALLTDGQRRQKLAQKLESSPDIRGMLVLDFHLADVMANVKGAEALLDLGRKYGVQVCFSKFDDHSNIDLLVERLSCDYVRLSPDLVHRMAEGEDLGDDLGKLTGPLRKRGIRLIAPMIEDAAVMASLWKSGVDYLQGNMIQEAEEDLRLVD